MNELLRRRVYQILARALRPPARELAEQVADGTLRRLLVEALEEAGALLEPLHQPGTSEEVREELGAEYYRLFQHPRHRLELAESVYKSWAPASAEGTLFAGERGLLMGEPARHLLELYRLTGWTPPVEFAGRPDHLALELAFMAHLVEHFGPLDQVQFLDDHLDWLPDLLETATAWEPSPFYAAILTATQVWVEQDRRMLRAILQTAEKGSGIPVS